MITRHTLFPGKIENTEQARLYREIREMQSQLDTYIDLFERMDRGEETGMRDLHRAPGKTVIVNQLDPTLDGTAQHLSAECTLDPQSKVQSLQLEVQPAGWSTRHYRYRLDGDSKTYVFKENTAKQVRLVDNGKGQWEIERGLPDNLPASPIPSRYSQHRIRLDRVETIAEGKAQIVGEWLYSCVDAIVEDMMVHDATPETWTPDSKDMNAQAGQVILLGEQAPKAQRKVFPYHPEAWTQLDGSLQRDWDTGELQRLEARIQGPNYCGDYHCKWEDGNPILVREDANDGYRVQLTMLPGREWLVEQRQAVAG